MLTHVLFLSILLFSLLSAFPLMVTGVSLFNTFRYDLLKEYIRAAIILAVLGKYHNLILDFSEKLGECLGYSSIAAQEGVYQLCKR